MTRIASLIASATEIVCALGFRDGLVARSHECDFPLEVADVPAVTAPKLAIEASSAAIDREVKALVEQGLSVYRVDADALRALAPDVIVTQTQCEVCAVGPKDLEEALSCWAGNGPRLVPLQPNALADVWTDIRSVGSALGAEGRADALVQRLSDRLASLAGRLPAARPRVACIEWIEPLMVAGNWVPELVEIAGGRDVLGVAGRHSPWLEWCALSNADPDIIVVMPCGFDIPRTQAEMAGLVRNPEWLALRAVREGRVFVTDGNQYFNRPGPRLLESAEILAEIFHGLDFGHRGRGWVRGRAQ